jgi:hypothetical protein
MVPKKVDMQLCLSLEWEGLNAVRSSGWGGMLARLGRFYVVYFRLSIDIGSLLTQI